MPKKKVWAQTPSRNCTQLSTSFLFVWFCFILFCFLWFLVVVNFFFKCRQVDTFRNSKYTGFVGQSWLLELSNYLTFISFPLVSIIIFHYYVSKTLQMCGYAFSKLFFISFWSIHTILIPTGKVLFFTQSIPLIGSPL